MSQRLAVFDCDGTLVDGQAAVCAAMDAAFIAHGLAAPDHHIVRRVVGLSLPQAIRLLLPDGDEALRHEIDAEYRRAFRAAREAGQLVEPLYAGIRETLDTLYDPVVEQVEIAAKYAGYIDRQRDEVERSAYYENLRLPQDMDYMQVSALSFEARQKLQRHRPETLGQASRISGITPAAISLLLIHLKRGKFKGFAEASGAEAAAA